MHAHSHTGNAAEQFPTGITGLETATDPETVEIADGGAVDLRIAGQEAARRRDRAHGRLQRLGARSDAEGRAGLGEWEDDMVEVNRTTTPANTRWKLIDRSTGARTTASRGASRSSTSCSTSHTPT